MIVFLFRTRRAPQGARGLKSYIAAKYHDYFSRAPQGARGLKFNEHTENNGTEDRRAPQGARGLKYLPLAGIPQFPPVAPRKGRVD